MQDRRINRLKERLLAQTDEGPVIRHLVDDNPRGDDMLGEVCRAAVLLHPSASFDQALTLDAYLANGMYSSSFPIVQVSILAFSYQDVSQELKNRIFGHICQAARVVRLANDLRTHEREAAQGRFNAIDLIFGAGDKTHET